MEAAVVRHVLLAQQQIDLFETFAIARYRFIRRDAERAELVRQERARKADVEPAVADPVDFGDFGRELERVVEGRDACPGYQPRGLRALRGGREKQQRVWAVAAIVMKVVLDRADVRVAERLRALDDLEAVAVVLRRRLVLRAYVGKELHAEFHRGLLLRGRGFARGRAERLHMIETRPALTDAERRAAWKAAGVTPLWEDRRAHSGPPPPQRPQLWPWATMSPLIDDAAALNSTAVVERRVLSLAHPNPEAPGFPFTITNLNAGFQILLPGESARPHRHSMNAPRSVIDGTCADTVVDGKACPMYEG